MKNERDSRRASLECFEALDPAQLGGLSDAQRDAIARVIVAQGPTLIRQASAQRMWRNVALGGAVAAAAALAFMPRSQEPEATNDPRAVAAAPSCAADTVATPVTQDAAEGLSISIGSRIRAKATHATRVSVVESEACVTRLALTEGTLTLQANDLGGGTLWVDTPHGQVRTGGTFMRIVTLASSTTLSVVEGAVVMSRPAHGVENVGEGHAVTIGGGGSIEHFTLSGDERASLFRSFEPPAHAVQKPAPELSPKPAAVAGPKPQPLTPKSGSEGQGQPTFSATALLSEGEALWRRGDHEAARRAFRNAAEDKGATGEAAWVRLARLELAAGSAERALTALQARKTRPGAATLGAEALWLEVQALEQAGRTVDATQTAAALLRDYPSSPQATAARRLMSNSKVP